MKKEIQHFDGDNSWFSRATPKLQIFETHFTDPKTIVQN